MQCVYEPILLSYYSECVGHCSSCTGENQCTTCSDNYFKATEDITCEGNNITNSYTGIDSPDNSGYLSRDQILDNFCFQLATST